MHKFVHSLLDIPILKIQKNRTTFQLSGLGQANDED